jgi:hypothetical protein
MTEEEIERRVEKMTDHLDRLLMTGAKTQRDYDKDMASLNLWAEAQYKARERAYLKAKGAK